MRIQNGAGNYGSGSNRTSLPMMFNDFRVGWTTYQTAPPGFTAWIDEVAIDSQRRSGRHAARLRTGYPDRRRGRAPGFLHLGLARAVGAQGNAEGYHCQTQYRSHGRLG